MMWMLMKIIPSSRKERIDLILYVVAMFFLIYGGISCTYVQFNCKAYQIQDQYGNPIPKEDLERIIESYNKKYDTEFLNQLMTNVSHTLHNQTGNYSDYEYGY